MLKSCWSHTPSKRPTAGEIVELLNSNPRLVSPCIDVPLASVQIERADEADLAPRHGKPASLQSQKSKLQLIPSDARERSPLDTNNCAYSPMRGNTIPVLEEDLSDAQGGVGDPLIGDTQSYTSEDIVGSYVQAGYILVDNNN